MIVHKALPYFAFKAVVYICAKKAIRVIMMVLHLAKMHPAVAIT